MGDNRQKTPDFISIGGMTNSLFTTQKEDIYILFIIRADIPLRLVLPLHVGAINRLIANYLDSTLGRGGTE